MSQRSYLFGIAPVPGFVGDCTNTLASRPRLPNGYRLTSASYQGVGEASDNREWESPAMWVLTRMSHAIGSMRLSIHLYLHVVQSSILEKYPLRGEDFMDKPPALTRLAPPDIHQYYE